MVVYSFEWCRCCYYHINCYLHYAKKHDKREYKMQIFKDVVAYRTDLSENSVPTGNLQRTLNQLFIAFNRDKKVIQAFENFRKGVQYKSNQQDEKKIISDFIALIKAMADNLKIDYSFSNDDLFTNPLVFRNPK